MSALHAVVGASGQIGSHVVRVLEERGIRVRTLGRADGDIGDPIDAVRMCAGAEVIYACFGGPHATWAAQFPRMTEGVLAGAERAGARVVFADNLYAYGPQRTMLTEDTPLHAFGSKPRLRADIAERFLAADRRGRVQVAIARASDLYGPGIHNAMVGASLAAAAMAGRRIYLPGNLDAPHTFSFVPDVARAMAELGCSEDAWGQIWHVPSAPPLSLRALIGEIAALGGEQPRVTRIPTLAVKVAGVLDRQVRELIELSFQWDRPYLVSHAKFAAKFRTAPTSIAEGLRMTCEWLMARRRETNGLRHVA